MIYYIYCEQVHSGGYLTLGLNICLFLPFLFDDLRDLPGSIIAIFQHDVDTARSGNVFYRIISRVGLTSNQEEIISYTFPSTNFELRQVIVATYDQVPQWRRSGTVSYIVSHPPFFSIFLNVILH